jgi:hypothetical protein
MLAPNSPGPVRGPIGEYDDELLYVDCEATFGAADSYAARVLLAEIDSAFKLHTKSREGSLLVADANPLMLLRFLVGVLWRASVSKRGFFRCIDLGPIEPRARTFLLGPSSPVPLEFDAFLMRRSGPVIDGVSLAVMREPKRAKLGGRTVYRIELGDVAAVVKADSLPFAEPFCLTSLRSGSMVALVDRGEMTAREMESIIATAKASNARREALRSRGRNRSEPLRED